MHLVVMGVSGSGKSTVGAALATALEAAFIDADDLHPPENKERMRRGQPLRDDDRLPWLAAVGAALTAEPGPIVAACSALRRTHRDVLRAADPTIVFIHLAGATDLVAARLSAREHEFMPPSLLASQYDTLEPPTADEDHVTVAVDQPVDAVVAEVVRRLAARSAAEHDADGSDAARETADGRSPGR